MKNKKYMPYGFNEKYEYEIYYQIGDEYRRKALDKKKKKQAKNIPSFDTYLDWKKYFINKFSRSFDCNYNFEHYLNSKLRINERKVDLIKSVAVPIYICEFSCLMAIYQSDNIQISLSTQIVMLLSAIAITVIASFVHIYIYSRKTQFYTDCISIVKDMNTSHQN